LCEFSATVAYSNPIQLTNVPPRQTRQLSPKSPLPCINQHSAIKNKIHWGFYANRSCSRPQQPHPSWLRPKELPERQLLYSEFLQYTTYLNIFFLGVSDPKPHWEALRTMKLFALEFAVKQQTPHSDPPSIEDGFCRILESSSSAASQLSRLSNGQEKIGRLASETFWARWAACSRFQAQLKGTHSLRGGLGGKHFPPTGCGGQRPHEKRGIACCIRHVELTGYGDRYNYNLTNPGTKALDKLARLFYYFPDYRTPVCGG